MLLHLAWSWGLGPGVLDSLWMLDARVACVCVFPGARKKGLLLDSCCVATWCYTIVTGCIFALFSVPISDNLPVADPPTYTFAAGHSWQLSMYPTHHRPLKPSSISQGRLYCSLEKRSPNLHKARGSRLKAPSPSAQLHCASVGVFDLAEASLGLVSDSFSLSSVSCVDYPSTHSYSTPTNHFSPSLPRANRHRPQTGG